MATTARMNANLPKATARKSAQSPKTTARMNAYLPKATARMSANLPKKPYKTMVMKAIKELDNSKGSSRPAILKYLLSHYQLDKNNVLKINSNLKLALKRGVSTGLFKQVKGTGASGSFRLAGSNTNDTSRSLKKIPKKASVAKKKAAAPKSPKKATAPAAASSQAVAKPKAAKSSPKKIAKKTKSSPKPKSPKKPSEPKSTSAAGKKASPKKKTQTGTAATA